MDPFYPRPFPIPFVQPQLNQPFANLTIADSLESDNPNKLYKQVHQRLNAYNQWESYRAPPPEDNAKYAFVVCIRRSLPNIIPQEETFLQIESKHLKNILKDCLTNVAAVFDSTPLVLIPCLT